jgi:tyrosine-protein kinase Etk/Wzc
MNQTRESQGSNTEAGGSVFDYFLILALWRKFIFISVFSVTLIAVIVSLLLPRWYASSATILPPKKQDMLSMLGMPSASIARQLSPLRVLGSMAGQPELYNYLAIINSRTMYELIIEEFDLFEVYEIKSGYMSDAIDKLRKNIITRVNEEGTLTIVIEDKDPERARGMARFIVAKLDSLNQQMSAREATENRIFIERRLGQNITELKATEDKLKEFQQKHSIIAVPEQAEGSISAIAQMYAAREIAEIELSLLSRSLSPDNPIVRSATHQLEELNKKIGAFPELGVEYFRLYRDFTVQQKLFEVIVPILEQARLEEQRDTPTLLVLDSPVQADRPHKPKKKIIVIVFFAISLIASIFIALVSERFDRLRRENAEEYDKFNRAVGMLWKRKK